MKIILLLLIPLLSITTLFAQQHNKSIFDSELSAEDAYIPFRNTYTKSNDNKLNILFQMIQFTGLQYMLQLMCFKKIHFIMY